MLLDADPDERRLVSAIAGRAGWSVVGAADGETAIGLLQGPHGREVQAALLGSWNGYTGPDLIALLHSCREKLPIIVIADGESVPLAVEAMRAGASDFLSRPVVQERLLEALAANSDRRRAAGELAPVTEKLAPELSLEQLVGAAPDFRATLAAPPRPRATAYRFSSSANPAPARNLPAHPRGPLRAAHPVTVAAGNPASSSTPSYSGHEKGAFQVAFHPGPPDIEADGGTPARRNLRLPPKKANARRAWHRQVPGG